MLSKVKKIKDYISNNQWFELVDAINRVFPNAVFIAGKDFIYQYDQDKKRIYRDLKKYEFKKACLDDLPKILECEGKFDKRQIYMSFFKQNRVCYIVTFEDSVVGFCWVFKNYYTVTYDRYNRSNLNLSLGPDCYILGNGYIDPKYRLRGLFPFIIFNIINDKIAQNQMIIALINYKNLHSIKSHERLGFRYLNTIYYFRLGPINFIKIASKKGDTHSRIFLGKSGNMKFKSNGSCLY